jgi:hypothetical protein
MTIKWASFLFWKILNPIFYTHHRYTRKKVVIDRFLESRTFVFNCGVGGIFGVVLYYAIAGLSPYTIREDRLAERTQTRSGIFPRLLNISQIDELAKKMNGEATVEMPHYALERARYTILTKMCVARDHMAIKRQRVEVERVAAEVAELKRQTEKQ